MTAASSQLVDTHCHLNLGVFEGELEAVLERAAQAGIIKILVPGIDLETSQRSVDLAHRYQGVYAAVGVHPHEAEKWNHSLALELKKLAGDPDVVALGEIGLDYYRNHSGPEEQRRAFRDQLEIALELELPVVIHNREAMEEILAILDEISADIPDSLQGRTGVLHAYSSSAQAASKAIGEGFYIGIAGPITFRNADHLRSTVSELPLDRLLTETDAPYLTPEPHRGKRNEPGNVRYVAEAIAGTREIMIDKVVSQAGANAVALFQWDDETTNSHLL